MTISHLTTQSCSCTCPDHGDARTPNDPSTWMTPEEVVHYLRGAVTLGTLRNYRSARLGPPFVKVGRAVFYPAPVVDKWLAEQARIAEDRWYDRA